MHGSDDPVELLRSLLRFDTSNPPGAERACIDFVAGILRSAGLEPHILARDAERPNLVVRTRGRGEAPPLLLYGHVDVVPANPLEWSHDPFAAEIVDGQVWGRGALDMKSGVAALVVAVLRAAARGGTPPAGDVILLLTSDEERGSGLGARYLVEEHADLFDGVRYALSEVGGFTVWEGDRRLYPIQVSEKQAVRLHAVVRGSGGHPSVLIRDTATDHLAGVIERMGFDRRLPRLTPMTTLSLREMGRGLGVLDQVAIRLLLVPWLTRPMLRLLGTRADRLQPSFRDTVTPTVVRAGDVPNVVPTEIELELDARLLPGGTAESLLRELRQDMGDVAEFTLLSEEPAVPAEPDLALVPMLSEILRERDPGCHPFPFVSPGYTDARHFSRLGIQTYGFTPLRLPKGFPDNLMHAPNERVPIDAVRFGADCIYDAVTRYAVP